MILKQTIGKDGKQYCFLYGRRIKLTKYEYLVRLIELGGSHV
jgi:hypothetical protein